MWLTFAAYITLWVLLFLAVLAITHLCYFYVIDLIQISAPVRSILSIAMHVCPFLSVLSSGIYSFSSILKFSESENLSDWVSGRSRKVLKISSELSSTISVLGCLEKGRFRDSHQRKVAWVFLPSLRLREFQCNLQIMRKRKLNNQYIYYFIKNTGCNIARCSALKLNQSCFSLALALSESCKQTNTAKLNI